jgi:hypothetical protein
MIDFTGPIPPSLFFLQWQLACIVANVYKVYYVDRVYGMIRLIMIRL